MSECTGSIPTGGENFLSLKIFLHHTGGGGLLDYTRLGTKYTRVTMLGLCPISSLKVNESLQKSFDAEHAGTASHILAPDDTPKLEVKTTKKKNCN